MNEYEQNSGNTDAPASQSETPEKKEKKGFFGRILTGLDKTRKSIMGGVDGVLKNFVKIDEDLFEELEETLILADIGVKTSSDVITALRDKVKSERITDGEGVKLALRDEIAKMLKEGETEFKLPSPSVILVIGVNGVGKTTSIGKLAAKYVSEGRKVMLAAADTFRAAAIDQLEVWGERAGVPVIKHSENSDPAAVVYDAVQAAKSRKADILICDTAGRLQNKKNLMDELKKISKVIVREYPEAHVETLIAVDASTGQNALSQAAAFKEIANVDGVILTKLDGTAKGGIILSIAHELKTPVRFIGIGEGIEDLRPFDAEEFAKALFDSH